MRSQVDYELTPGLKEEMEAKWEAEGSHLTRYVRVMLGDFLFGDNDGVQLIPKDLVDEVLLRMEKIYEKENEEREVLASGMPIDEVYRVYKVLQSVHSNRPQSSVRAHLGSVIT